VSKTQGKKKCPPEKRMMDLSRDLIAIEKKERRKKEVGYPQRERR